MILKNLPPSCKVNIIKFGSSYEELFVQEKLLGDDGTIAKVEGFVQVRNELVGAKGPISTSWKAIARTMQIAISIFYAFLNLLLSVPCTIIAAMLLAGLIGVCSTIMLVGVALVFPVNKSLAHWNYHTPEPHLDLRTLERKVAILVALIEWAIHQLRLPVWPISASSFNICCSVTVLCCRLRCVGVVETFGITRRSAEVNEPQSDTQRLPGI